MPAHSRNWILVLHIYLNPFLSQPHLVRDTEVLAKWFLNVLNAITKSEEKLPILKIRIFDTSLANAFKSDKEKLNSCLSMKGNQEYNDLVNGVVSYLLNEGLILEGTPPAKVSITNKGIGKCKETVTGILGNYPFSSLYCLWNSSLSL